jgi:arylsulfatase A-like enzyme
MKNILLIVVDCARTEKTILDLPGGDSGTRRSAILPLLDLLRGHGTTWTNLSAVSSTTTPNFASMFTGLLPLAHGIQEHSHHSLRPEVTTVAEILRQRGWSTYAECTGPLIPEAGLDRGFDHYRYRDRTEYLHTGLTQHLAELFPTLREPWFLCLHLWEAHMPYQNPAPFDDASFGHTPYDRSLTAVDHQLAHLLARWDMNRTTLVYCSDHGERLVEDYALERALGGQAHEVLAAHQRFCAGLKGAFDFDNWFAVLGAQFGEDTARIFAHNVLGHGFHLTEDLIRIPLVIVDTDRCRPGAVNEELRSQLDLGATLLDLADIPDPGAHLPGGESLLEHADQNRVYIEANGSGGKQYAARCYLRGARSRQWKYWRLETPGCDEPTLKVLWDLENDPRETHNVAADHLEHVDAMDQFVDRCLDGARTCAVAAEPANSTDDQVAAPPNDPAQARAIEEKMRELGYL